MLRQAPDVILIGEIRDAITAETAVRAANSGHLVLASLHAPSALGAVQSMLSLGVILHFLSSSLQGVIAQRLVRTLCPACKVAFDAGRDAPDIRRGPPLARARTGPASLRCQGMRRVPPERILRVAPASSRC